MSATGPAGAGARPSVSVVIPCYNAEATLGAQLAALAAQGYDGETFLRASKVWIERMGQQMAVGQKFRQYLDAS